jgi:hypothetical protein
MVLVAAAYMCIIVVKSYWKIVTTNVFFRENDGKGEIKSSPTALHSLPPAHQAQESVCEPIRCNAM